MNTQRPPSTANTAPSSATHFLYKIAQRRQQSDADDLAYCEKQLEFYRLEQERIERHIQDVKMRRRKERETGEMQQLESDARHATARQQRRQACQDYLAELQAQQARIPSSCDQETTQYPAVNAAHLTRQQDSALLTDVRATPLESEPELARALPESGDIPLGPIHALVIADQAPRETIHKFTDLTIAVACAVQNHINQCGESPDCIYMNPTTKQLLGVLNTENYIIEDKTIEFIATADVNDPYTLVCYSY